MSIGELKLKSRTKAYFNDIKPKFSPCEECIYVARGCSILQYNVKTGLLIAEYQENESHVVGFDIVNTQSTDHLIACFANGALTSWKTITHFKSFTKKIPCEGIQTFHYLPNSDHEHDERMEGIVSYSTESTIEVALVNISKESLSNLHLNLKGNKILIGVSSRRFLAVIDKGKLHFCNIDNPKSVNTVSLSINKYKKKYTCMECHSTEEIVITGDSDGQVIIWYGIFTESPTNAVYHWHTLPVNCLAFSSSGSYFYSGGNENVLVRWDWENSQNKKFLPRLSNNIQRIGVSSMSQLVAICTSDNSMRIVDSAFNDVCMIQHLIIGDNYKSGIQWDPRTKSLIMNANVGQIQFYQPNNDTLIYTTDVVGQNQLTNERNFSVQNTQVTKFCINKNSSWLATLEGREVDENCHQEMRLKFWNFNACQQTYELSTSIENPHDNAVLAMEFQFSNNDDDLKCVTVGADKKFKVWHITTIQQANIDRAIWNCLSIGFYRDLPCNALSFSVDGSLMAIGFDAVITVWSPDICELKCSLLHPKYKSKIEFLRFGTCNQCHLVVAAMKNRICVWNLLTLTMIWTVPLQVEFLLANSSSQYMVAITRKKELFVFSPNSPKPICCNRDVLAEKNLMAASIIPVQCCYDSQSKWYQRMELFLIDSNKEIFSISVEDSNIHFSDSEESEANNNELYSKILPLKKVNNASVENRNHLFNRSLLKNHVKKYLEAPVHTMIPIRLTCASLLKSFVTQKSMEYVKE